MVKDTFKRFLERRAAMKRVKQSAQLARAQVKAFEAEKRLVQISKLERAESKIRQARRADFKRTGVAQTGRGLARTGRAIKKRITPIGSAIFKGAASFGSVLLTTPALNRSQPAGPKRGKKKGKGRGPSEPPLFDPNFRF